MKTLILILICTVLVAEEKPAFAGIALEQDTWQMAQVKLKKAGFVTGMDEGCLLGKGWLVEHSATVVCLLEDNAVIKVHLGINLSEAERINFEAAYRFYNSIRDTLVDKYGKPSLEDKVFVPPYEEGDGRKMFALREKKGMVVAFWDSDKIVLRLHHDEVTVGYESETFDRAKALERAADKAKF